MTNTLQLSAPTRQSGFSLLELLVAFAIMAVSVSLLYRVAGNSARNTADIGLQQHSVWLAESLLTSRTYVGPEGWNESGESAGFMWQVRSAPFASGVQGPLVVPMHQVSLVVSWATGFRRNQFELQTLLPERKPRPGELIR